MAELILTDDEMNAVSLLDEWSDEAIANRSGIVLPSWVFPLMAEARTRLFSCIRAVRYWCVYAISSIPPIVSLSWKG